MFLLIFSVTPLDMRRLKSPLGVVPPNSSGENDPQEFLTQDWLNEALEIIRKNCAKVDTDRERVPPLGLIRCSRGGKTRALKEIAQAVKTNMRDTAAIFVSFNDFSSMQDDEKSDLVTALCRRIAFAALKITPSDRSSGFNAFRETTSIDKKSIIEWLDKNRCVLLIDELNVGTAGGETKALEKIYDFLKSNFLSEAGRYLVFSSHVISTAVEAGRFMDSMSNRRIEVKELPIICSLVQATNALRLSEQLSATKAIYNGLVPALILDNDDSSNFKRIFAVNECCDEINDNHIVKLMQSFISGEPTFLPPQLLPFMNTAGPDKIRWIPRHIIKFLTAFASNAKISPWVRYILDNIANLFEEFKYSRSDGGLAWENLFQITVLVRSLGGIEHDLLPIGGKDCPYVVSYNSYKICRDLNSCKNFNELYDQIIDSKFKNTRHRHVAVIAPKSSQFETYDLFVFVYEKLETKPTKIFAYQLKQGGKYGQVKCADMRITKSFLIRGKPREGRKKKCIKDNEIEWYVAIATELSSFFGASGNCWTPAVWQELSRDTNTNIND